MRRFFLALALTLLVSIVFGQLAIDYVFSVSSGTHTPITGGTVLGKASSDAQVFVEPAYPLRGSITTDPVAAPILMYPEDGEIDLLIYGFNFEFAWNTAGVEPDVYTLYVANADDLDPGFTPDDFFSVAHSFEDISSPFRPNLLYDYESRYLWTVNAHHNATDDDAYKWPPNEFQTEYDGTVYDFPWTENFEYVVWDRFPPSDWRSYDVDGDTETWTAVNNNNHTAGGRFSAVHIWGEAYSEGWLVTPPLVLDDDEYVLHFWNMNVYPNDYDYNGVLITTGIPEPDHGPWTELWNPGFATNVWALETVNLSAYSGQTVQLAFVYKGEYAHAWFVDDVTIRSLTTDNIPPIITLLPLLSTPRDDIEHPLSAHIVDDEFWNNPIVEANLFYSVDYGNNWSPAIPMTLGQNSNYTANIPAQELGTTVTYKIEAWDSAGSMGETEGYTFTIDDPVWVFYNYAQDYQYLMPSGIAPHTWGVFNYFENPLYGTGYSLYLYATQAATWNPQTNVHLNIYLWDGSQAESPLSRKYFATPIPVDFGGINIRGWDTFEFSVYNDGYPLEITDPFFAIAFENLPDTGNENTNSYFLFDTSYDYGTSGMTMSFDPGSWYTVNNASGSWSIAALIGEGEIVYLDVPEVTVSMVDGSVILMWDAVPNANSYCIYASDDPMQPRPWELYALNRTGLEIPCEETEERQFFYVEASSVVLSKTVAKRQYVGSNFMKNKTLNATQPRQNKDKTLTKQEIFGRPPRRVISK